MNANYYTQLNSIQLNSNPCNLVINELATKTIQLSTNQQTLPMLLTVTKLSCVSERDVFC